MTMDFQTLILKVETRVALLTINRPEKMNALDARAKLELRDALVALGSDPSVDCVIITGAGERAFVAGTDIQELTSLDGASGKAFSSKGQEIFDMLENLDRPVIAAVNGYALGGGCELALACHIRIASVRAKFGQPEVGLGIIPGYGGTQRLARIVGTGKAFEMILSGVQVDAAEALRIGLVNAVVPPADLIPRSMNLARVIGSNSQVAVRKALQAVRDGIARTLREGLAIEASAFGACCDTEDFKEGTRAFLEKRKPVFRGR